MRDAWRFVVAGGALVLAIVVAVWLAARGRGDDSRRVLADGFEGMAKQRLDKLRAEYERAAADARVDSAQLHESAARFEAERAKLQSSYERLGLSADEIERRFSGMRL
jgi:hypothetical protein